jgi:fructose-bisphosphate aldolase class II
MWNAESLEAILLACQAAAAPVILMIGPMEIPLLGAHHYADLVRMYSHYYDVPICLHLDHGVEIAQAEAALEAGFGSVMLDYSDYPFAENVAATRRVVELARRTGASVEAEIGHVGMAEGSSSTVISSESTLTDPAEAVEFVAATGVDALAISVGTAHGMAPGLPELDFDRLAEIDRRISVPLVLHGGTGRGPDQVQRAISLGVRKLNIASDLNRVFVKTAAEALEEGNGTFWHTIMLAKMKERLQPVVAGHLEVVGAAGKAGLYGK